MMARANGTLASPPADPMAIGNNANQVVIEVIKIGRSRTSAASRIASRGDLPSVTNRFAKSIKTIDYSTTIPTIMMIPMKAIIDKCVPVAVSTTTTPMKPSGTVSSTMRGSRKLRNWATITR